MDKKNKKLISFNLTHNCNFTCDYCNKKNIWDIEDKRNQKEIKEETIKKFEKFIRGMNEKVIIRLTSDGETLIHKKAFELIEIILNNEQDLILSTNFSSPVEIFEKLVNLAKKSEVNLFISIHPSQIDLDTVYNKIEQLDDILKNSNIKYHLIAAERDTLSELSDRIKEKFNKNIHFINLYINEKPVYYFEARNFFIDNFILKKMDIKNLEYKNKCMAGRINCEIDKYGNIYRCRRELKNGYLYRISHIGNNKKKLKLLKKDLPCFCMDCFHKKEETPIEMTSENLYYIQRYIVLDDFGKLQNKIKKFLITAKRKIFGNKIFFNHDKDK